MKGFETIDLQNLIRQMPGYKEGSELQAEIRSSARRPQPMSWSRHVHDAVHRGVRDQQRRVRRSPVPEVPDGQEDAAREAIECCPEQAISEGD